MPTKPLINLTNGETGKVIEIRGGHGFKRRLATRGIQLGKTVSIVAKQPRGPIVVKTNGCQLTMGKGMARKVVVEVI